MGVPPRSSCTPSWSSRGECRSPGRAARRGTDRRRPEEHVGRALHPFREPLGGIAVEPVRDRAVDQAVERRGEVFDAQSPAEISPLLAAGEELHEQLERRPAGLLAEPSFVEAEPDLRDLAEDAAIEALVLLDP